MKNQIKKIRKTPCLFQVLSWWARVTGSWPGSLYRVSTVLATWPCQGSLTSFTTGGTSKWPSLYPLSCLLPIYGKYCQKKLLIERIDRLRRSQSFFIDVLSSYSSYFLFYHSFFLSSVENSKHSHTKTMFRVIKKTKLQNFKFCV